MSRNKNNKKNQPMKCINISCLRISKKYILKKDKE